MYLMKGTFMCEKAFYELILASNMWNVWNDVHDIIDIEI